MFALKEITKLILKYSKSDIKIIHQGGFSVSFKDNKGYKIRLIYDDSSDMIQFKQKTPDDYTGAQRWIETSMGKRESPNCGGQPVLHKLVEQNRLTLHEYWDIMIEDVMKWYYQQCDNKRFKKLQD